MRVNRKCPHCNGDVRVTKTITAFETGYETERLQHLLCLSCGATAFATVKTSVDWKTVPTQR